MSYLCIYKKVRLMKDFKKIILAILTIIVIVSFIFTIIYFIIKTTLMGYYAMFVFAVSSSVWFVLGLSIFEEENPSHNNLTDDFDDGGVTFH